MKTLTLATLTPAASRSIYVEGQGRTIEVSYAVACEKREAEGCALVMVDGDAVAFLYRFARNQWMTVSVRKAYGDGTWGVFQEGDRQAAAKGATHFLRMGGRCFTTRREALMRAGYVVA